MIPERGKIRFRKPAIALFATLAALAALSPAGAQPYPNRAIKLVVPYSAGSGADITARQTMAKLSGILGQSIVIENRPGASGMTGTDSVARAAPMATPCCSGSRSTRSIRASTASFPTTRSPTSLRWRA